jgi:L-threonylcarbamoyladenylate synthase
LQLLQRVKQPIAAPSANRSGRPSGTTWQSVLEDLDGAIDAILCGPGANVGLESTVLDLCQDPPRILRAGAIRREDLLPLLPNLADDQQPGMDPSLDRRSPGTRHPHYQPQAEVILVDRLVEALDRELARTRMPGSQGSGQIAFLGLAAVEPASDLASSPFRLSHQCATVEEYASKFFEFLREADRQGCRTIYCQRVDEQGLGVALMDRLRRASES